MASWRTVGVSSVRGRRLSSALLMRGVFSARQAWSGSMKAKVSGFPVRVNAQAGGRIQTASGKPRGDEGVVRRLVLLSRRDIDEHVLRSCGERCGRQHVVDS